MLKSVRTFGITGVAALALVLMGCGNGRTPAEFSTPEECFQFAQNAVQNKHYEATVDCMTAETQELVSGMMVTAGSMTKTIAGFATALGGESEEAEKMREGCARVDAVLKKHGVNEKALEEIGANNPLAGALGTGESAAQTEGGQSLVRAMARPVQDHGKFVADMLTALEPLKNASGESPVEGFVGELEDLQVTGDQATAKIVKGNGEAIPIGFKLTERGWRIHLDASALQQQHTVSETPTF